MGLLLLKRVLDGLLTLLLITVATFLLIRLLPGGPFDQERRVPPAIQRNLEAQYHLHDPLPVQLMAYMGHLLQGDLGPSYQYKSRRVQAIVAEACVPSFLLGGLALALGVGGGMVLGTLAGVTTNPWVDKGLLLLGVTGLSAPSFLIAGGLVLVFSIGLGCLPTATLPPLWVSPAHWVLPTLALAVVPFAYSFLLVRTSVQDVKQAGFVRIKRSFGLPEPVVVFVHIARNALLPLVAIIGPIAAALLTGSFAIESMFAIPGLGKHFVSAVLNRDYTLVMGITLLYATLLIVLNTLSDILALSLNPKLRDAGH
jgi:oligopeptide transport system permease protein